MYADMKPIFIGGCRRSGTTMLGSMLGASPHGICIPEAQFVINIYRQIPKIMVRPVDPTGILPLLRRDIRFRLWRLDDGGLEGYLGNHFCGYEELIKKIVLKYSSNQRTPPLQYWVDHTPTTLKNITMLIDIFPEARFIHIVRDGRAVAASLFGTIWGPKTIHTAAQYWLKELAYCLSAEVRYGPQRIMRVRYEDVLFSPEYSLRKVCSFCGIAFHPDMAKGGSYKPPFGSADQHRLVGHPPETRRASSWQNAISNRQIEIFEDIAGEVLYNMGYQTVYWPHTNPVRGVERYLLDLKELFHRELTSRIKVRYRLKRELS